MKMPAARKTFNTMMCALAAAVVIIGSHLYDYNRTSYYVLLSIAIPILIAIDLIFTIKNNVEKKEHRWRDIGITILLCCFCAGLLILIFPRT